MPAPLDEEEIENIIETWKDLDDPSYSQVAQQTNHSKDAVKKYVEQWRDEEGSVDPDFEEPPGSPGQEDDEGSLFTDPNEEMAADFKDFMKLLNDRMNFGMKEKAINMMAAEIEQYGQLPTQSDVVSFLESTDSGIRNANELTWIGQRYQNWKKQYEQKRMIQGDQLGGMMGGGQPTMMGSGPPQEQAPGMTPPQQGMGMGGMNPMMMMFQQMQQQMEALREELRAERDGQSDDMLEEKTKEYLEQRLNRLISADTTEEQEEVIQELRALRHEIGEDGAEPVMEMGQDLRTGLIQAASRGDIDMSEAKDLLQDLGEVETNPQVLEKKYEKQIREQELEHQSKRTERLGDLLEEATERFGQSLGQAIVQGGDVPEDSESAASSTDTAAADGGGATAPQATQPPQPQQAPQASTQEPQECKHCGATLLRQGNQVVCPECEFGVGPCDICSYPVEIPPRGEANYAHCAECETATEVPAGEDVEVGCENCGWEGPARELRGELLQCDGCGEFRPIIRQGDREAQQARMMELLDADSDEILSGPDGEMDEDLIEEDVSGD